MLRGILATTAAIALAIGVNVSASDGPQGHGASSHGQSPAASGSHGNSGAKTTSAPTTTTKTTATTTTTTTKTTTTATLSPVQQKVASHTQLANKLQSRLPSGTNVVKAASGFRNLGQFVAAVNVSHNLGIPFKQLKTDLVTKHMSLGQSIRDLRPSANSTQEAQHAETDAEIEIEHETTTTTKTTTTTTTTKPRTSKKTSGGDK